MKKSIKQVIGKRIASIMMSAVLAVVGVGLLPQFSMSVHAVPVQSYDISSASVNETFNDDCTIEITGSTTSNTVQIEVAAGKTVTVNLNNVSIATTGAYNCAFKITGAGNVIINLIGTNTLASGTYCAGLQKESTGTLTITGTGTLTATGGIYGAGIGGGSNGNGSNIYISGGTVTATGETYGAGIGGGNHGDGSNIYISGGTVTATGETYGAGIGGGNHGDGYDIEISGGTVIATDYYGGAGIGGGKHGDGYNISISGSSTVMVAGGLDYNAPIITSSEHQGFGAAIGSGGSCDSNNSPVDGTEFAPDISGLYTTGSIRYYPAGTSVSEINNGTVQPTSTVIGSASVLPTVTNTSESEPEPELPVNYMQEVEDQINAAIRQGGPQTVIIKGYDTLSYDVLKLLKDNPQITLVTEFTYKDVDFKLTIPGDKVELNPEIRWYGPKCLYPMFYIYSTDITPDVNTYIAMFK